MLDRLCNNKNVIMFMMSKSKSEMNAKAVSKERKERERELIFYLRYYKELRSRGALFCGTRLPDREADGGVEGNGLINMSFSE